MLTSSPTISAPASPSAFHSHARSYHASRRTSASSTAHSPRFPQVSGANRRLDAPPTSHSTNSAHSHSPVPAFARSPQISRRREYADAGTQYTPPEYPPTYRPSPDAASTTARNPVLSHRTPPETNTTATERGETSAEVAVTEPPEPELRIEPQPVVPSQNAAQPSPRTSREVERPQRTPRQEEQSEVVQQQSSPAKRARPQEPSVKIMPLKYETCDVKDLGVLISDMLMELVRLNDGFPLRDGQLTRFHSR